MGYQHHAAGQKRGVPVPFGARDQALKAKYREGRVSLRECKSEVSLRMADYFGQCTDGDEELPFGVWEDMPDPAPPDLPDDDDDGEDVPDWWGEDDDEEGLIEPESARRHRPHFEGVDLFESEPAYSRRCPCYEGIDDFEFDC